MTKGAGDGAGTVSKGARPRRAGLVLVVTSALALYGCTLSDEGTGDASDAGTGAFDPTNEGLGEGVDAERPGRRDGGSRGDASTGALEPEADADVQALDGEEPSELGPDASPGSDAGPPDMTPVAPPPRPDLGRGDGKDVITLGDSWMLGYDATGIQPSLLRMSKQGYRPYAFPGTRVLSNEIARQYARAKAENPNIETVVMTGGGTDLVGVGAPNDCETGGPACKLQIDRVLQRLATLWDEMATDGVSDVIYVGYSRGDHDEGVNYGTERGRPLCAAARLRCHWLDSDTVINRELRADRSHPTPDGYEKLARAVAELMEREGMRR